MKTADFAAHLTEFLSHYLPELKNISTNTISSYCDAFRLFLGYCQDVEGMRIEKLSIDDLTPELVDHFLQWLRIERNNGTATRSQRLAAIRSFVKYLQIKEPRLLLNFQQILAIPVKRAERKAINPLTKEAIALILRQPDTSTLSGRRDATILCFLYDTAARVQEICDLRIDELYLWLSDPTVITYIRNALKRVRKKESALFLASQNLEDFTQPGIRELTRPLFSIPVHQFIFNGGNVDKKFFMDNLQLEESEYALIRDPQRGSCLYKCGNERYLLQVRAPEYKQTIFGTAGGR